MIPPTTVWIAPADGKTFEATTTGDHGDWRLNGSTLEQYIAYCPRDALDAAKCEIVRLRGILTRIHDMASTVKVK